MPFLNISTDLDMKAAVNGAFQGRQSSTAESYVWTPNIFTTISITALSGLDDITTNPSGLPLTGTISALLQVDGTALNYTVTDLNAPLTQLIGPASPLSNESYWETILAGATTLTNDASAGVTLSGDFLVVAGETVTGAADTFDFTINDIPVLVGDAFDVRLGATLTGGADRMSILSGAVLRCFIVGDVETHAGTVTGGADVISYTAAFGDGSVITGDVGSSDGVLIGGADQITVNAKGDFAADLVRITGDAVAAFRQVTGGNDTIVLQPGQAAPFGFNAEVAGDVHTIASANALVTGGNDTITAADFSATMISGDVHAMSNGVLVAGNDAITVNGGRAYFIAGDAANFTGGTLTPGSDTIRGGSGVDTIFGESTTANFPTSVGTTVNAGGNDVIDGRDGNDFILGQVGADTLTGGRGNDVLNGGSGNDTVSFASLNLAVFVDLAGLDGTVSPAGNPAEAIGQGLDDISNTENVIGSNQRDTIKGDAANNVINGGAGADFLSGRGGTDTIVGGAGADRMRGGAGNDTFDFNFVTDTGATAATADVIFGFEAGDRIDLSNIDADPGSAVNSFSIVGTLSGAGQIAISQNGGNTLVSGSTDSDAAAEFVITIRGLVTLAIGDFVP